MPQPTHPPAPRQAAPRALRTLFNLGTIGDLTDGQLLERFATRDGEAAELAFAALVERHGPMVLRACRSVLRDQADAQDAFQATFLVLSRRADALWVKDSIGPWLFAVALRVARHARSADARRRRHERRSAELAPRRIEAAAIDPVPIEAALLSELDRLPPRFRDPVVLCDLQGRSYDQAARHLGLPVGTLKSRLARGRSRLRDRLRRLGLAPNLATFSPASSVPGRLLDATAAAATRAAAGLSTTAGTVPASVLSLASGALWMMRLSTLIRWTAAASAIALAGVGVSAAAGLLPGQDPPSSPRPNAPEPRAPAIAPADGPADPMISYDIRFIEAPGLTFRSQVGIDLDYDTEPPMGIAFLSDLEVRLLLDALAVLPDARVTPSQPVSHDPGAPASVSLRRIGSNFVDEPFPIDPSDRLRQSDPPPAEGDRDAEPGRPAEGVAALVRGTISADDRYLVLDLDFRDVHVVAMHPFEIPGLGSPTAARAAIPEVVRSRYQPRVTIPDGGGLLVGLGLRRTVDFQGRSALSDAYVLLTARTVPRTRPRASAPPPPPPAD